MSDPRRRDTSGRQRCRRQYSNTALKHTVVDRYNLSIKIVKMGDVKASTDNFCGVTLVTSSPRVVKTTKKKTYMCSGKTGVAGMPTLTTVGAIGELNKKAYA